jgi:PKD repeat protein
MANVVHALYPPSSISSKPQDFDAPVTVQFNDQMLWKYGGESSTHREAMLCGDAAEQYLEAQTKAV